MAVVGEPLDLLVSGGVPASAYDSEDTE